MKPQQAWQAALGRLQMEMPKTTYDTWLSQAEVISHEDDLFTIGVQNAYARDWVENRLAKTIATMLTGIMNSPQRVQFVVDQKCNEEETETLEDESVPAEAQALNTNLNSRYGFTNFVVGASNRLAHAACMAVAERPAKAYNPLFIYGGVGLGKTHLLQAIGNSALQSGLRVLYITSEEFTNDLINSIRSQNTQSFRDRYRRIDVMLVDDIQFIAGKESTQEEFFHTFNALYGQDKQIVMTSDRPPKAMVTLEERLRSRFEWGLQVDIQPPDLETRMAILRSKAERAKRQVPNEIIETIARLIQSNIRELEGSLTRVMAFSDLSGQPLSPQLVNIALADLLPQRKEIEPRHVVDVVALAFGISGDQLLGRDRSRGVALPRQVAMYLLREETKSSLPQIGNVLGGRDHTTVMYACDKVADLIERDDRFRRQIIQIREQLYGKGHLTV
jgi:chromosomal replication initiator protein